MIAGRGAWDKNGMPPGVGTGFYQLLMPEVGSGDLTQQAFRAVNFGVRQLQTRINEIAVGVQRAQAMSAPTVVLQVDGVFGPATDTGLRWAQREVKVVDDGQAGPLTCIAFFMPIINAKAGQRANIVGGIVHLESGFDPGAVGFVDDGDIGLAQINLPSNPGTSEATAFDYHHALTYVASRIQAAFMAYHNKDAAICSYNSPEWAQEWEASGDAPNPVAREYVNLVRAWKP